MKRIAVTGLVAGCWGSSPPATIAPPGVEGPPTVALAVAGTDQVTFVEASGAGLAVKRTVKLPSNIGTMYWVGREPVVLLSSNPYDELSSGDEKLDGKVGRITMNGFEPYPPLPDSTWSSLAKPVSEQLFEVSRWQLVVTANGEVWVGHCIRAIPYDMQPCDGWGYARIDKPGPATETEPVAARSSPLPKLAASKTTTISLVPFTKDGDEQALRLHCESPTGQLDYPPEGEIEDGIDKTSLVWISTEPPIYRATDVHRGAFSAILDKITFEGCELSKDYKNAELVGGPSGMVALYTRSKLSVRWRGRELGTLAGAHIVRFAPLPN